MADRQGAENQAREADPLPGALRCAWCGKVLNPHYCADPRGSDGICPNCMPRFLQQAGIVTDEAPPLA